MNDGDSFGKRLQNMFFTGYYPFFWLVVISFFLYLKTLTFKFAYFDDNLLILNNQWFLGDIRNVFKCFRESVFLGRDDYFYRPVMMISLMLDAQIGGTSPFVYHFTNVLLHACSSVLLYILLIKLSYSVKPALLLSALFAVHPALTQTVAWIPGRNDSLLAVFAFLTFIYFIKYVNETKPAYLFCCVLFFNLALYTKETALMLAPVGMLYWWLVAENRPGFKKTYLMVLGLIFSAALWAGMRHVSQQLTSRDIISALPELFPSLVQYIGKAVLPFNLSVFPILRDTTLTFGWIALALIVTVLLITPRQRIRRSLFGISWFFLFLLPPMLLPVEVRLEHRLYLPMAGLLITLAEAGWSRVFPPKGLLIILSPLVIILFAGITFVHSDNFINRLFFWESAVKTSPHSSNAHNGLALRYLEYGKKDLSEQELRTSIMLNSRNVNSIINLAMAYIEKGRYKNAANMLKAADIIKPDCDMVYYYYGLLFYLEGKDQKAVEFWVKALRLNSDFIYSYRTLAAYYFMNGDRGKYYHYSKQLKDRFGYTIDIPEASIVINKRKWLYDYSASEPIAPHLFSRPGQAATPLK